MVLSLERATSSMDIQTILAIAKEELTINIRNKWTIIFAVVFGLLVVSISYFGTMAEGFSGMQDFTRTSASILNLVLYVVPLVALTMGTLSFTGDKGSTELLYSQPISRAEVLVGKFVGVFGPSRSPPWPDSSLPVRLSLPTRERVV